MDYDQCLKVFVDLTGKLEMMSVNGGTDLNDIENYISNLQSTMSFNNHEAKPQLSP